MEALVAWAVKAFLDTKGMHVPAPGELEFFRYLSRQVGGFQKATSLAGWIAGVGCQRVGSETRRYRLSRGTLGKKRWCSMPSVLTHKASDLKPLTREVLESEFGRRFQDDEEVSIMAFRPHEPPAEEARRQAGARLEQHFQRMDARTKDIGEDEVDDIVIEAMRSVRPGYRERRPGPSNS